MRAADSFTIGHIFAALILAMLGEVVCAAPQFRIDMGTPQYLDTHSVGINGEGAVQFKFLLLNGETANPPFTLRTQLPPHVTYRSSIGGGWSCSVAGSTSPACTRSR